MTNLLKNKKVAALVMKKEWILKTAFKGLAMAVLILLVMA
jgi:hypothetical protein